MRKPEFRLCENKGTYQLCSNCTADQRICFRYTDEAHTRTRELKRLLPRATHLVNWSMALLDIQYARTLGN